MKMRVFMVCLVAVALSACSKSRDSTSKDADGNCNSSFVIDYNSIVFETKRAKRILDASYYSESEKISQLTSVKNACQKFKSNHSGVSCKAEVDYQEKWISSSDFDLTCNAVNSFFANKDSGGSSNSAPAPDAPPPATAIANPNQNLDGVKVKDKDRKDDYSLVVVDASKLLSLLGQSNKFAVDGKIYDSRYLTSADRGILGKTLCLSSNLEGRPLKESDLKDKVLTLMGSLERIESNYRGSSRALTLSINELGIGFGCLKSSIYEDFTWLEVQKAFAGILEVKKVEQ